MDLAAEPLPPGKQYDPRNVDFDKGYPFCDIRMVGLSLMDFVAFSFLPYFEANSPHFDNFYRGAINTEEWTLRHIPEGRSGEAVFIDIYSEKVRDEEGRSFPVIDLR